MLGCDLSANSRLSERGEKILSAAQALFLKHGYENTSLEMIINEAGGSRRSIYSEFGNKQGLLMAVLKRHIVNQIDVLTSINYELPPEQALTDVCGRFVQGFLSPTMISLFRLVTQVVVKLPEIGELIFNEGPLKGVKPLADYLQHLHDKNELEVEDCYFSGQQLIEMCKGRLHLEALLLPNQEIAADRVKLHVEKAVALFLKAHKVPVN